MHPPVCPGRRGRHRRPVALGAVHVLGADLVAPRRGGPATVLGQEPGEVGEHPGHVPEQLHLASPAVDELDRGVGDADESSPREDGG